MKALAIVIASLGSVVMGLTAVAVLGSLGTRLGSGVVGLFRPKRRERVAPAAPTEETNGDDPVLAMLAAAPEDDESVTEHDRRHIAAGRETYRNGETASAGPRSTTS